MPFSSALFAFAYANAYIVSSFLPVALLRPSVQRDSLLTLSLTLL
jgi:hypothetical protein